jgi:hypothetical protein
MDAKRGPPPVASRRIHRGQAPDARPDRNSGSALNHRGTYDDQQQRQTINEDRRSLFANWPLIAFVCECPREACYNTVTLSAVEYDARRPGLITAAGHATPAQVRVESASAQPVARDRGDGQRDEAGENGQQDHGLVEPSAP